MRLYVAVTGIIFALLVVAHVARMVLENVSLASDPIYLFITAMSSGLSIWSWVVFRNSRPRGEA
jgi:hypothetical protein